MKVPTYYGVSTLYNAAKHEMRKLIFLGFFVAENVDDGSWNIRIMQQIATGQRYLVDTPGRSPIFHMSISSKLGNFKGRREYELAKNSNTISK